MDDATPDCSRRELCRRPGVFESDGQDIKVASVFLCEDTGGVQFQKRVWEVIASRQDRDTSSC